MFKKKYEGIFEKVSLNQFAMDMDNYTSTVDYDTFIKVINDMYENIKIPERSTHKSAGCDFCIPFDITLYPGDVVLIPTGIRFKCKEDYYLNIVPRSGLGFKYKIMLANTNGIIDADYYESSNEGHIMIKLVYDGLKPNKKINLIKDASSIDEGPTDDTSPNFLRKVELKAGDKIAQGIITKYYKPKNEKRHKVYKKRNGGFGSTGC